MSEPMEHRVSPELVAALLAIQPLTERLQAAIVPRPGSLAARDGGPRVGRHALELAIAALALGVEHLEAWRLLAFEAHVLPPFVYLTLLRAGIEGAVLARWLLEPGITRDARRSRGLGAQWADYDDRRKFEQQIGAGLARTGKRAVERIRDLEEKAKKLRLPITKVPTKTRLCELYAMPLLPPQVRSTLGGELYRMLSGTPHGRQWSLPAIAEWELLEGLPPRVQIARLTIDEAKAAALTTIVVRAIQTALADLEAYTVAPAAAMP